MAAMVRDGKQGGNLRHDGIKPSKLHIRLHQARLTLTVFSKSGMSLERSGIGDAKRVNPVVEDASQCIGCGLLPFSFM